MMNYPFRARDFSGAPNPHPRRQHRSSSSASFQHPPHTSNAPPTHEPRQASLNLDFIIIGGGLFHVFYIILFRTDALLGQESPGFPRRMPSLPPAIAYKFSSKHAA